MSQIPDVTSLPPDVQQNIALETIFMPVARRARDEFFKERGRYVHYTSAEAALNIIRTKRLWMRNAICMSDFREVIHGHELLLQYFGTDGKRDAFFAALDQCHSGVAEEVFGAFDQWWASTRIGTYIASISEHVDSEDRHGRLSMWRAFGGGGARVALVLKLPFFSPASDALRVGFSPVAYLTPESAYATLDEISSNIHTHADFIKSIERTRVASQLFDTLLYAVTCLKHEAFLEEREWRVIYHPKSLPALKMESPFMTCDTEVISGVPQQVYKLPLDSSVSPDLADVDFAAIFDRLIIGPSVFGVPISQAFIAALENCGVADAAQRVVFSGIPIRT